MNRKMTGVLSSVIIMATMTGCTTSYKADQRNMDLGKEVFKQEYLIVEYVDGVYGLLLQANDLGEKFLLENATSDRQSDEMMYGMLKDASDKFKNSKNFTPEEYLNEFHLEYLSDDKVKEYQNKVAPILTDMASLIDGIIDNENFDGTISDKNVKDFEKLNDEYNVYYYSYYPKP